MHIASVRWLVLAAATVLQQLQLHVLEIEHGLRRWLSLRFSLQIAVQLQACGSASGLRLGFRLAARLHACGSARLGLLLGLRRGMRHGMRLGLLCGSARQTDRAREERDNDNDEDRDRQRLHTEHDHDEHRQRGHDTAANEEIGSKYRRERVSTGHAKSEAIQARGTAGRCRRLPTRAPKGPRGRRMGGQERDRAGRWVLNARTGGGGRQFPFQVPAVEATRPRRAEECCVGPLKFGQSRFAALEKFRQVRRGGWPENA